MKLFICLILGSITIYGSEGTTGTTGTTTTTTGMTAPTTATTNTFTVVTSMSSTYVFNSLVSEGMEPNDAWNIALAWRAPMAVPHYYTARLPESKDNTKP